MEWGLSKGCPSRTGCSRHSCATNFARVCLPWLRKTHPSSVVRAAAFALAAFGEMLPTPRHKAPPGQPMLTRQRGARQHGRQWHVTVRRIRSSSVPFSLHQSLPLPGTAPQEPALSTALQAPWHTSVHRSGWVFSTAHTLIPTHTMGHACQLLAPGSLQRCRCRGQITTKCCSTPCEV